VNVTGLGRLTANYLRLISIALCLLMLGACSDIPDHLSPSGYAIKAPAASPAFQDYIADTREQLRQALEVVYQRVQSSPFGENYPLSRTLEMRSPFEISESPLCPQDSPRTGYLLLHGLTDSPYLLTAVARSLAVRSPCTVVRSVLLPGHGTVPGDSLDVHRDEWREITRYGVNSFQGRVDKLYLVGYSAGASLAVEYADQHRDESLLAGLILLSPAFGFPDASVALSPYLRWFARWLGPQQEQDAAKYETLAINAGAEFYLLVQEMNLPAMPALNLPVFMVVSGADSTVDVAAAEQFFCEKVTEGQRQLVWYSSINDGHLPVVGCSGTYVESVNDERYRLVSLSHVGLTTPANDPHYGADAGYRQCLHYSDNPEQMLACKNDDSGTVYGERSLLDDGLYDGLLMRRATFNPLFTAMMERVDCFFSATCEP
jgi:esterase/lipase